jgi:hypothetical protein
MTYKGERLAATLGAGPMEVRVFVDKDSRGRAGDAGPPRRDRF